METKKQLSGDPLFDEELQSRLQALNNDYQAIEYQMSTIDDSIPFAAIGHLITARFIELQKLSRKNGNDQINSLYKDYRDMYQRYLNIQKVILWSELKEN